MLNKLLLSILFFVFIVMILLQNIKLSAEIEKRMVVQIPVKNCNAQKQRCQVELDGFKVEILFDENIYYLKPFNVSVWNKSKDRINFESIKIDFKMKNMDMGVNRFKLKKISSKNKEQHWQGTALLPICVSGRADWFSELEFSAKKKKYIFSIPVIVKRARN